jgi:hypothetical protein
MTTLQKIEKQGYKVKPLVYNLNGVFKIGSFAAIKDSRIITRSKISLLYKAITKTNQSNN